MSRYLPTSIPIKYSYYSRQPLFFFHYCSLDQYVCSGAWLNGICTGTDTPADITPENTQKNKKLAFL